MKELKERIREIAENLQDEMLSFTQKVIQCPSLSGEEENVAMLYLQELQKLGYDEAFLDKYGNVVGIVKGTEDGPSIMYNGHLDHVDIGDLDEWKGYEPYGGKIDESMILKEDRNGEERTQVIHGRAASDTKSGMACQVYSGAVLARLKKEGYGFKGNYIYSGVVLEEPAEQIGMRGLIEDTFAERNIPVDGVVSCEATGLQLYLGHRGRVELSVDVEGVNSHASAPWLGVNAVTEAARLILEVEHAYADAKEDKNLGKSTIALTNITCSPGSMCIVPDRCHLTFDRRFIPGETAKDCVKEMEELISKLYAKDENFHAKAGIGAAPRTTYTGITKTVENIKEAWKISTEHPFVKAAAKGLEAYGEPVSYGYWDFGTDLAIICGGHGIAGIGYSPMKELYCHRPVDMCRTDFMKRAVTGNIAIFMELCKLDKNDFKL